MPLAKINYFPKKKENGHQFFITTGWIERFAQKRRIPDTGYPDTGYPDAENSDTEYRIPGY